MKKVMLLLLVSSHILGLAQERDSVRMQYAATITVADLKEHLEIISSDLYEGRETGKRGQKLAAEYIANHFKSLEIPNLSSGGYYQIFPLIEQQPKGVSIEVANTSLKENEDFVSTGGLLRNDSIRAEVVFAGYGRKDSINDDFKGLEIKGKIVLLFAEEISGKFESNWLKVLLATEMGAKAVLINDKSHAKYVDRANRFHNSIVKTANENAYKKVPAFFVNKKVTEQLLGTTVEKAMKNLGKRKDGRGTTAKEMKIEINRETTIISSENVLGYIEGTDKSDELLVVTAHYDHIGVSGKDVYNGADDDGSGTVALLEMAEAFMKAKKEGYGPRRSILFMTVSGEEKGLLGSKFYTNNPVFPLENTIADLNIDMIGRHDPKHTETDSYIYVIGADKLSRELHDANEQANNMYVNLVLDYTYNDDNDPNRFYYRSDHYNFAEKNVPVIFYFSGVHEDYHKLTDTVDKINFKSLEERTKLVFYTAWELVNRDKRITLDKAEN